jgi:hypothetical protein
MSYLDDLKTARDQVASNLKALTASPKPNYSLDGESYTWQGLFDSYVAQLERLNALLAAEETFEEASQAGT